jgi:hypothetical protein
MFIEEQYFPCCLFVYSVSISQELSLAVYSVQTLGEALFPYEAQLRLSHVSSEQRERGEGE